MKSLLSKFALLAFIFLGSFVFSGYAGNVTIKLCKSNGSSFSGATVQYQKHGSNKLYSFGTTSSKGQVTKSLSSGEYYFILSANNTSFKSGKCTVLKNGSVSYTYYTTKVSYDAFCKKGKKRISGVGIRFSNGNSYGSNHFSFGNTNGKSRVCVEMFPGYYTFCSNGYGRHHYKTHKVCGDGHSHGQETDIDDYLTSFTFKSEGGSAKTPVSGVNVQYAFEDEPLQSFGTTNASGTIEKELAPGVYTFVSSFNGTSKEYTVTVPDLENNQDSTYTFTSQLTKMVFYNSTYANNTSYPMKYGTSTPNQNLSKGVPAYVYPGILNMSFGPYKRSVEILESDLDFERMASIIILKDHNGNLLSIDAMRGGFTNPNLWNINSSNASTSHDDAVWIYIDTNVSTANRTFEVSKGISKKVSTTQNITSNHIFKFQTNQLALKLQNCGGNGIANGVIRYGINSPNTFWPNSTPTDANGKAYAELFPGNFKVEMAINQSTEIKDVNFSGDQTEVWTTTLVKFNYPGEIAYGGSGWSAFFPSNHQAEMLPSTVNFSFRNNGEHVVAITIPPASQTCAYENTAVIAKLIDSKGFPIAGGVVDRYQNNAWTFSQGTTGTDGKAVIVYNGTVTKATMVMNHKGTRNQENDVDLSSVNNTITFQTKLMTMSLVDAAGSAIEADENSLGYYAGNQWRTFGSGSTTNGKDSMELLATSGSTSFAMMLNGTRQQYSYFNMLSNQNIDFHAKKVRVYYKDSSCIEPTGSSAQYYAANQWRSLGNTTAGFSQTMDMLHGGSYSFKVGAATQKDNINISEDSLQTITFNDCQGIRINVFNSNGDPIKNASITRIVGNNTSGNWTTDNNGNATIIIGNGSYSFRVTVNGTNKTVSNLSNGSVVNLYTTTMRFVTMNGDDNPVSGVAIDKVVSGGVQGVGTTNSSGILEKEYFPYTATYNFSYKQTKNTQTITVGGDGFTSGQVTTFNSYLTKVNFHVFSNNDVGVNGASISVQVTGGYSGWGTTGNGGYLSVDLYPQNKTFKGEINLTSRNYSLSIIGDGLSKEMMDVEIPIARVLFHNYNSATQNVAISRAVSGGVRGITGNGAYHFPGTYRFYFRSGISLMVAIDSGVVNYEKVVSIIRLKDHSGNPLSMGVLEGGVYQIDHTINNAASVESDATWVELTNPGSNTNRMYRITKNVGTSATQTKDVYVNNIFDFQTNQMKIRLENCSGTGLASGVVEYGKTNITTTMGSTDVDGEISVETFPGNFVVRVTKNYSKEQKNITFSDDDTFTWTSTFVTINNSGTIQYGGSTGSDATFPSGGTEMLSGITNFKINGNTIPITVPPASVSCTYTASPSVVNIRLIDSKGNPIQGATARWADGSWHNFSSATNANGVISEVISYNASSLKTELTYKNVSLQKIENFSSGDTIVYQTVNVKIRLTDYSGDGIVTEGTNLLYATGSWQTFGEGETNNGIDSMELLPSSNLHFSMNLNGTVQTIYQNPSIDPIVIFKATEVFVHYTEEDNNSLCVDGSGINVIYGIGSWYTFGSTDNYGMAGSVYMLPGNNIRFKNNAASIQKEETISSQSSQTIELSACQAGAHSGGIGDKQIEVITLFPNPVVNELYVTVPWIDDVMIEIYSSDGRLIFRDNYNNVIGTYAVDVTSYAQGAYLVKASYDNKTKTAKFLKQ